MIIKIADQDKTKNDAFLIRKLVFVNEQNVPLSIELDEHDEAAIHFVGYIDGEPMSASRLRIIEHYGKLERISVLKQYRGNGYGKKMIQKMEERILEANVSHSKLNAQTHAVDFYKKLGYKVTSKPFNDAGIPHVTMEKQLNN